MITHITEIAVQATEAQKQSIINFLRQRGIPHLISSDMAYRDLEQVQGDSHRAAKGLGDVWYPKPRV